MRRTTRRGTNAVEFALILPTFVLLLFAVMDFGWLFFQRATLDIAATHGCRAGALVDPGQDEADMASVQLAAYDGMRDELYRAGGGDCTDSNCYVDVFAYGDPPGRSLICVIGKDFEPPVGMLLSPRTIESSIAVRMEWQRWPDQ